MLVDTVNFLTLEFSMQVINKGSVRVDLVGGTLDIEPINLIIKNVITLNVATSLKAAVTLTKTDFDGIEIISKDYNKSYQYRSVDLSEDRVVYSREFQEMTFVLQILRLFSISKNLRLELSSGAPAGSGLGGSSAMGVTLYKALCSLTGENYDRNIAVQRIKAVESRILKQGVAGYQDYFPALTGGILGIKGIEGEIKVEQLYSDELKTILESHLTLIYSGQSRASGINNWEVYKGFFDKKPEVVEGLSRIAEISYSTYEALKARQWEKMLTLIALEGLEREKLFPGITTDKIRQFTSELKKDGSVLGLKMCGAGGGGCFILIHKGLDPAVLESKVKAHGMEILPFKIESPL
jgi:D-glycero-alpha-D-manno-heptose-7-phosphate kinase